MNCCDLNYGTSISNKRLYDLYSIHGWKHCEIKRYHVCRWLKSVALGGVCKSGHSRNPWWRNMDQPRSKTVPKWLIKRVRFEVDVLRQKGRV